MKKAWFFALIRLFRNLSLTLRHARAWARVDAARGVGEPTYAFPTKGAVTLRYPHERLAVPENGRYRLHNEIDDCIVCDKCVRVCPVNCITITSEKAPEVYGYTADKKPKRLRALRFEIDMAKCCFCGLCTSVCPTDCLTMAPVYDYSVYDLSAHKVDFVKALRARSKS